MSLGRTNLRYAQMNIFKSNTEKYRDRLDEEFLFGAAAQEIANGVISPGLYAKALAECNGDEKAANAHYMKLRVDMMKSERSAIIEQEQTAKLELLKQSQQYNEARQRLSEKRLNPVVRVLATLLGLLLAVTPFFAEKFELTLLMSVPFGAWLFFCGLKGKSLNPFTGKVE